MRTTLPVFNARPRAIRSTEYTSSAQRERHPRRLPRPAVGRAAASEPRIEACVPAPLKDFRPGGARLRQAGTTSANWHGLKREGAKSAPSLKCSLPSIRESDRRSCLRICRCCRTTPCRLAGTPRSGPDAAQGNDRRGSGWPKAGRGGKLPHPPPTRRKVADCAISGTAHRLLTGGT